MRNLECPRFLTGLPSETFDQIDVFYYNALGQQKKSRWDRNGTEHTYIYDVVGRMTEDRISTLGTDLDGAVLRLASAYDTAGRPSLFSSYDATTGGNVVNEVRRDYNGLGQLTTELQCHTGQVSTCTSGAPSVQYAYSALTANHSRPTSMIYPDGRVLNYNYSGLDSTISRLSTMSNGGTTYEQYAYLGLGTVVKRTHQQGSNEIGLTYVEQPGDPACTPTLCDAGDPYRGLDRFGRVIDQRWIDIGAPQAALDRFSYGYDRNSNRLYRANAVNAVFSELYHSGGAAGGYDQLNQLTGFKRGTLNAAKDDVTSPSRTQNWTLDTQGNWSTFTTNGTPQDRTHNYQNQATQVGGNNLAFDNNGNTKTDENGRQYVYDAWNRLVEVKTPAPGSVRIVRYSYDALGRRIKEENGTTKDFYYSAQWQLLEERHGGSTSPKMQYVWSPVYVDALVLRDRDANGSTGDGLEERRYVQQDANWNVTAIINPSGQVLERYVYDPYGQPTVLDGSWQAQDPGTYDWLYLHQGGRYFRFDVSSGTYHFRHRELSATLGRWLTVDPIRFLAGDTNFYRFVHNRPIDFTDPAGLIKGEGKYKDCDCVGWKEVRVQPNVLAGARNTVANDFKDANEIYEQCCIRIVNANTRRWDPKRTAEAIGEDLILDNRDDKRENIGIGPWLTGEVRGLYNEKRDDGVVSVYYIGTFADSFVLGFTIATHPVPPMFVMSDAAYTARRRGDDVTQNGNIWSHELGHVLLATGDHQPPRAGWEPNLMMEKPNVAWVLSEIQCNQMRRNSLTTGPVGDFDNRFVTRFANYV